MLLLRCGGEPSTTSSAISFALGSTISSTISLALDNWLFSRLNHKKTNHLQQIDRQGTFCPGPYSSWIAASLCGAGWDRDWDSGWEKNHLKLMQERVWSRHILISNQKVIRIQSKLVLRKHGRWRCRRYIPLCPSKVEC